MKLLNLRTANLIVTFLFVSNHLFGQTEPKVITIRNEVNTINNGTGYKIKTLTNDYFTDKKDEVSDNGQELKGYYKDGKLKKLTYYAGLSNCIKTYEYYLDNAGKLIFVFESEKDFPELKDGSLDHSKLTPAFEGRYYFDKGKLISSKTKGEERSADDNKTAFLGLLENFKKDLKHAK